MYYITAYCISTYTVLCITMYTLSISTSTWHWVQGPFLFGDTLFAGCARPSTFTVLAASSSNGAVISVTFSTCQVHQVAALRMEDPTILNQIAFSSVTAFVATLVAIWCFCFSRASASALLIFSAASWSCAFFLREDRNYYESHYSENFEGDKCASLLIAAVFKLLPSAFLRIFFGCLVNRGCRFWNTSIIQLIQLSIS